MKAIVTKYLPATNYRGSRIKASDGDKNSITISYPDESRTPHADAAIALCHKMNWEGELLEGGLGNQCVFVFADSTRHQI